MLILDTIFSGITTAFGYFKEKTKAKHELEMASIKAKTEVVLSRERANSEWELAQLRDKDKFLRWAAFMLFASPLLAALINPEWGKYVQSAWHSLQDWQANALSGICLSVFGLKSIPRLIGSSVGAVKDALNPPKLPEPKGTKKK